MYWLVNLVAYEFKHFSEGLLIVLSGLAFAQFEVNLGEVHTDGSWDESLEKFVSEINLHAVVFWGSSAGEFASVNSVDVEGDPVFGEVASVAEVLLDVLMDVVQFFDCAVLGLKY